MKSLRRCCVEVIASSTDCRLTRDLMLEAVPYSSASIFAANEICDFGGRISEIMDVPFLPKACKSVRAHTREALRSRGAPSRCLE